MGNTASNNQNNPNEEGGRARGGFLSTLTRILTQIIVMQLVMGWMKGKKAPEGDGSTAASFTNIYKAGMKMDMLVYLSNALPDNWEDAQRNGELIWELKDINYTSAIFSNVNKFNYTINLDPYLEPSSQVFATTIVIPEFAYLERGETPWKSKINPQMKKYIVSRTSSLIKWMEPFTASELLSLMGGNEMEVLELEKQERIEKKTRDDGPMPHLISTIDIRLIYDSVLTADRVGSNAVSKVYPDNTFTPLVVHSDFWTVERDYILLDETLKNKTVTLRLSERVFTSWMYGLQTQLDASISQQHSVGLQTRKEGFMMKRIMLDTSPYMLVFSLLFMILHSIFSFFAFRNDMQFWYRNDSMEGLSALSVIATLICEIIVILYLLDAHETSWIVLFEYGLSVALSAWKVTKAVKISFKRDFPFVAVGNAKNYVESSTRKYDEIAIKWMSIALLPCTFGYAVYALYYYKYRSWYSYVISILAGVVYTFGFIMMTPQLYINYKLKSVDHLPWRALMYKSLNTFVDDVASFLIDMPWMHRFSCLRDDVIFIIYLYQRWIYKVDKTRQSEWIAVEPPTEKETAVTESEAKAIEGETTNEEQPSSTAEPMEEKMEMKEEEGKSSAFEGNFESEISKRKSATKNLK